MSQLLLETIKIQDGVIHLPEYHQQRMCKTMKDLWGTVPDFSVSELSIPVKARTGLWKCRVVYSPHIVDISFEPYTYKKIHSLQCVYVNDFSYAYKFANRTAFEQLLLQKNQADEILIIKNGFVTDTSYSNIVFFDGDSWYTPSSYLLPGTMREYLIETCQVYEKNIQVADISSFKKARLLNAFNDLQNGGEITCDNILQ
ncbi:MAG: aminotransferase class IV [Bacteroidales bacterium]|jgi:4-amino-4-deoxychorismate lyase|nr:aminotransferase class IV [Bacteroidales bacterium]